MAESKNDKSSKKPDVFADDLDSLLGVDESQSPSNGGLLDDDDAIDRLLVDDAFQVDEEDATQQDRFGDFDELLADASLAANAKSDEIDEFGDDIDDIVAQTTLENRITDEPSVDLVPAATDEPGRPSSGISDLDSIIDTVSSADAPDVMREIDEFSDELSDDAAVDRVDGDFLIADFDISSVDGEEPTDEFADQDDLIVVESAEPESLQAEDPTTVSPATRPAEASSFEDSASAPSSRADYSAAIAALTAQLADLKKLQKLASQTLEQKAGQDELAQCLASVETLEKGQKTLRRNLDGIDQKKPVAAYVANGLAIVAIGVGLGFGYQGYIAKKQVGEIVEYLGKLQKQIAEIPTADASEKEVLRKQLDELNLSNTNLMNQVAELSKVVQTPDADTKVPPGSDHEMQMGAAIEALQAKVAALEKGRSVSPAPKPVVKKAAVVEQNWAVNLVAFKQDWYARRKADEFAAKGVPAKVSATESKGETWYRLSVDGFKTQYEAASYAARVKKTLNLDSVWVAKVKD